MGYFGPAYKKLAPRLITYTPYAKSLEELKELKKGLLKVDEYVAYRQYMEDKYIESYYETRLKDLDISALLFSLKEKFGEGIILLCHEPVEEFCHRRLLADFIELKTGVYLPEVCLQESGKVIKLNPIRYKDRLRKIM